MYGLQSLITLVAAASIAQAHTVITYPGWRGNNLHTNGSFPGDTGSIGMDFNDNGTIGFPYGMQWMYPCKCLCYVFVLNSMLTDIRRRHALINEPNKVASEWRRRLNPAGLVPRAQSGTLLHQHRYQQPW